MARRNRTFSTILIATFGRGERRGQAAIKYFLYAFIPSALLLVAMLWLYAQTGTFDLPTLAALAARHAISPNTTALWLASIGFLLAFAVKVPVFPLHGWLASPGRCLRKPDRAPATH